MNTMEDLRIEVAQRLRASIHGKEIDMVENVRPRLPHMLGITPLNAPHNSLNEMDTLLDPNYYFWDDYEDNVETSNAAEEKIQTSIKSLREDGFFEMTYPHGEEAEVVYCEITVPDRSTQTLQTSCETCGGEISAEPNLLQQSGHYYITFSLDCPNCEFSQLIERKLNKR